MHRVRHPEEDLHGCDVSFARSVRIVPDLEQVRLLQVCCSVLFFLHSLHLFKNFSVSSKEIACVNERKACLLHLCFFTSVNIANLLAMSSATRVSVWVTVRSGLVRN